MSILSDSMIDQLHFIVSETDMDSFSQLSETKNDGEDGNNFSTVTWTNISSDIEDIIEKLRKIAKTSSGNVFDKGELIFREYDEPIENPYEMEESAEADEIDDDDDILEDHETNIFDDLD